MLLIEVYFKRPILPVWIGVFAFSLFP